jgi:hypothetical protein
LRLRLLLVSSGCPSLNASLLRLLRLPPRLLLPSGRLLPLLAVHQQENQRGGQTENHDALHKTVVVKIQVIAVRHTVSVLLVQIIVISGVVIL